MRPIRWTGLAVIVATVSGCFYLWYTALQGAFAPAHLASAKDLNMAAAAFFGLVGLVFGGLTYPLMQSSRPIKLLGTILAYVASAIIAVGGEQVRMDLMPWQFYLIGTAFWLFCLSLCAMDVRSPEQAG
ncbi:MAG: hypothetical protein HYY50_03070 [Candidatus Kerfeldbacteria bacterium]|nr:hypothetical protein [Candidatus Kerfeldbacteria bacterium]